MMTLIYILAKSSCQTLIHIVLPKQQQDTQETSGEPKISVLLA